MAWAAELHGAQSRKGSGAPYLAHLLAVASLVLEAEGDEDAAIAALLHDAVEDQGGATTASEIARRFGPAVAAIVRACSDTEETPKPPWRARKETFVARLIEAPAAALVVIAADKLHNARSLADDLERLGPEVWRMFRGGRAGTLWYYRAVYAELAERMEGLLLARLAEAVARLELLAGGEEISNMG
jgi:(p)ppGpp synthase/HD superfamily hydrolase